jgi:hypothetical protein
MDETADANARSLVDAGRLRKNGILLKSGSLLAQRLPLLDTVIIHSHGSEWMGGRYFSFIAQADDTDEPVGTIHFGGGRARPPITAPPPMPDAAAVRRDSRGFPMDPGIFSFRFGTQAYHFVRTPDGRLLQPGPEENWQHGGYVPVPGQGVRGPWGIQVNQSLPNGTIDRFIVTADGTRYNMDGRERDRATQVSHPPLGGADGAPVRATTPDAATVRRDRNGFPVEPNATFSFTFASQAIQFQRGPDGRLLQPGPEENWQHGGYVPVPGQGARGPWGIQVNQSLPNGTIDRFIVTADGTRYNMNGTERDHATAVSHPPSATPARRQTLGATP